MERADTVCKPTLRKMPESRKPFRHIGYAAFFILPGFILAAVFVFFPMIRNIQISMSSYTLLTDSLTYTGLENYRQLLVEDTYQKFWLAYRNNLLYAVMTVPATLFLALAAAVMINSVKRGALLFRFTYYLPVVTSWIVVGLVFKYLFNAGDRGLVNYVFVDMLHVLPEHVNWLGVDQFWESQFVIWVLGIWKGIGWAMVVYLAALQSVPQELYEAAGIEGAGWWSKFWRITLPLIRPVTFFLAVQLLIGAFNVFLQVLVLLPSDPTGQTGTLQFLMYEQAFHNFNFGEGAAIGVMTAASILIITLALSRYMKLERLTL